ncbi:CPBP family intramembrane glutamic endopeptidase [Streptomyces sp. NPDC001835]|uniref:CPBP family intramembrane glutamic endopeptidase n=1 Tax=Streptomyces sp. NPDC001835 TaxID=3154528 RepID=UPI00332CFA52
MLITVKVDMLMPMSINTPEPYGRPVVQLDLDPVAPLPFHQLARAGRHGWWRSLVGTVVVAVGGFLLMMVLIAASEIGGLVLGRPTMDGMRSWGSVGDTALELLSIAIAIPTVFVAARWVQGRPAGTVSSVAGRLRRRWLGLCLGLALPVVVVSLGVMFLLSTLGESSGDEVEWVGWRSFFFALIMLILLVPLQAAAEEYVFRGWLMQAVGAWLRSPWIAVLPQAVLFAAAHGWGTVWGFVDLVVFGALMGILAVRTGGLEASIALHTLNNLISMGVAAGIKGALESDETAADMDWVSAAIDISAILIYAATVLWFARRRGIAAAGIAALPARGAHEIPPHHWPVGGAPLGVRVMADSSGSVGVSDRRDTADTSQWTPATSGFTQTGQVEPTDARLHGPEQACTDHVAPGPTGGPLAPQPPDALS